MPGSYLTCRYIQRAGPGPAEVGIFKKGLFYEKIGNSFGSLASHIVSEHVAPSMATEFFGPLGNSLFAYANNTTNGQLFSYDESSSTWTPVPGLIGSSNVQYSSGFVHVTGKDGRPYLVITVQDTNATDLKLMYFDGYVWSSKSINISSNSVAVVATEFDGLFIGKLLRPASGAWEYVIFDPATTDLVIQSPTVAVGAKGAGDVFFTIGNRLFFLATETTGTAGGALMEFVNGTWVLAGRAPVDFPQLTTYQSNANNQSAVSFQLSSNKVLIIAGRDTNAVTGNISGLGAWTCELISGQPTFTDVTNNVIPGIFRPTSSIGSANYSYGIYGVTDLESGSTPEHYLWFIPDLDNNSSWALFKVIDDANTMQLLGNTAIDNEWTPPTNDALPSSAIYSNYQSAITISVVRTITDIDGIKIIFRLDGDPLVFTHNAVVGGPFEEGESVSSSSGGSGKIIFTDGATLKLGSVVGQFNNGDTITQTSGTNIGAQATQTSASTGLSPTRTVQFKFSSSGLSVPLSNCSLVTGSAIGGGTVSGNSVVNCIADPTIFQAVVWAFQSDGLSSNSVTNIVGTVT